MARSRRRLSRIPANVNPFGSEPACKRSWADRQSLSDLLHIGQAMRQERRNGVLDPQLPPAGAGAALRKCVLTGLDHEQIEIGIGVDDGYAADGFWVHDPVDAAAELDITAEKRPERRRQFRAAMLECHAARREMAAAKLPAYSQNRGHKKFDLMTIAQPGHADILERQGADALTATICDVNCFVMNPAISRHSL